MRNKILSCLVLFLTVIFLDTSARDFSVGKGEKIGITCDTAVSAPMVVSAWIRCL